MDKPLPFDESVAVGVRSGDPDALAHVYRVLSGPLTAWLRSQVRDPQLAEDLSTETFLKLVRGCRTLEGGPLQIRSWLYRVAQRNVIDHRRRRSRRPDEDLTGDIGEGPEVVVDIADIVIETDGTERMIQALRRLSPEQAQVLTLRFIGELTAPEVAEVLGKTEGAVRALQHRAVTALAKLIRTQSVPVGGAHPTERIAELGSAGRRLSHGG